MTGKLFAAVATMVTLGLVTTAVAQGQFGTAAHGSRRLATHGFHAVTLWTIAEADKGSQPNSWRAFPRASPLFCREFAAA